MSATEPNKTASAQSHSNDRLGSWISVDDKLPDDEQLVITCWDGNTRAPERVNNDIIDRLKNAETKSDGEVQETIHDAWREIAWLREGIALSKRAVEIAETTNRD